jgi:hypothetical protein
LEHHLVTIWVLSGSKVSPPHINGPTVFETDPEEMVIPFVTGFEARVVL